MIAEIITSVTLRSRRLLNIDITYACLIFYTYIIIQSKSVIIFLRFPFLSSLLCHVLWIFILLYLCRELLEQVAEFEKTDFKTTDKVSLMCNSITCSLSVTVINHVLKVYLNPHEI